MFYKEGATVTKVFVWCFFEVHMCQSVLNLKIKLLKLNKRSDASLSSTGVKQCKSLIHSAKTEATHHVYYHSGGF